MATEKEILQAIDDLVQSAAAKFNGTLPNVQQKLLDEIMKIAKDLDVKNGRIATSAKNLRIASSISSKLYKLVVDKEYKNNVKEYLAAFNDLAKLQNSYYTILEKKFKPTKLLAAVQSEAVNAALDGLTDAGLKPALRQIRNTLTYNITTGGSYKDLMQVMSNQIVGDKTGQGSFSSAIKTLTITSVAQYSRNYSQIVASGLQFQWYQYVGSTITTTRCFCHAMTQRRYFHISEVQDIIEGKFKEFEKRECEIDPKTELPDGFIKGTNPSNFFTYAGGWNCQHSIFPVPESRVPEELKAQIKRSLGE